MDQRIDIDRTTCEGHGLCAELLPEQITGAGLYRYAAPPRGRDQPRITRS
ncbi:ferredoxin [Streptomyces sp. Ag109_G2-15]